MSLSVQFLSLLAMIGSGIIAAAAIDVIGTGISHMKQRSFMRRYRTFFEVCVWLFAGIWSFMILYYVRDGAWRIYDPLAQLSGLLLYISFFYRPFRILGRLILYIVIKPIWFVFYTIFIMIKALLTFIYRLFILLLSPFILIFSKFSGERFKKKRN